METKIKLLQGLKITYTFYKKMIISKTPYRISLFGGGTDHKEYYNKMDGLVIGGAINKYLYLSLRKLPIFFDHTFRVSWSKIENVNSIKKN